MNLKILSATFDLPLKARDISRWRGAWAEMAGYDFDRFHNHRPGDQGVIYRYPLMQYRCRRQRAAFFAMQDAVSDVEETLSQDSWEITWNREPLTIGVEDLRLETFELYLDHKWHHYRIRRYLPFNSRNFQRWEEASNLIERVKLINDVFVGHIFAFASEVGWRIPGRLEIETTHLFRHRIISLHDLSRPAFDLAFRTNIFLPSGIGLGKGVSHGFGVVYRENR